MWGRRLLYALTLLAALLGQLFDVGYLFHFLFFAVLALPVLSLLVSLPAIRGSSASGGAAGWSGLCTCAAGPACPWPGSPAA